MRSFFEKVSSVCGPIIGTIVVSFFALIGMGICYLFGAALAMLGNQAMHLTPNTITLGVEQTVATLLVLIAFIALFRFESRAS